MSKAILVIDMPDSCDDCNLCYYSDGKVPICYWKDKVIDKIKPDWCPLKPAPKHRACFCEEDDYMSGYNDCLNEILGDNT